MNMNEYRLVVCEKPPWQGASPPFLAQGSAGTAFFRAAAISFPGASGILRSFRTQTPMMKVRQMAKGGLAHPAEKLAVYRGEGQAEANEHPPRLMHREDVCEVVTPGDAGREGRLIFRTAYNLNSCRKRVKRLWISSMEDAAILQALTISATERSTTTSTPSALCRSKADCWWASTPPACFP